MLVEFIAVLGAVGIAFNSLFEMLEARYAQAVRKLAAPFNSLFEMLGCGCRQTYSHATTFNSLFEMLGGSLARGPVGGLLVLSILYLRCLMCCFQANKEFVMSTFNSLFEMPERGEWRYISAKSSNFQFSI